MEENKKPEFKGIGGDWFLSGGREIISMPSQDKVAKVFGNSAEELAANGKIIAAAPELLEVLFGLYQLKKYKEVWGKDANYLSTQPELWKRAEEAIKKALK